MARRVLGPARRRVPRHGHRVQARPGVLRRRRLLAAAGRRADRPDGARGHLHAAWRRRVCCTSANRAGRSSPRWTRYYEHAWHQSLAGCSLDETLKTLSRGRAVTPLDALQLQEIRRPGRQIRRDADQHDHRAARNHAALNESRSSRAAGGVDVAAQVGQHRHDAPAQRQPARDTARRRSWPQRSASRGRSADSTRAVLPPRVTATIAAACARCGQRHRRFADGAAVRRQRTACPRDGAYLRAESSRRRG